MTAATTYHFDCKPERARNDSFRTLNSKFDGDCSGCGEKFFKGDKIAYFFAVEQSGSNQRSAPGVSFDVNKFKALEREFVLLQDEVKHLKRTVNSLLPQPAIVRGKSDASLEALFGDSEEAAF